MSKGRSTGALHNWRTARDHKAATRHFWRCRCIELVAVPWACDPGPAGRHVTLLHPAAHRGAEVRHRLLTYRIIKEICNAARELARFPAPFFSVLPDLFVLAEEMASGINGARLLIIPQSGHLSPLEQPTDVTQALIDLLRIPVDGNDI